MSHKRERIILPDNTTKKEYGIVLIPPIDDILETYVDISANDYKVIALLAGIADFSLEKALKLVRSAAHISAIFESMNLKGLSSGNSAAVGNTASSNSSSAASELPKPRFFPEAVLCYEGWDPRGFSYLSSQRIKGIDEKLTTLDKGEKLAALLDENLKCHIDTGYYTNISKLTRAEIINLINDPSTSIDATIRHRNGYENTILAMACHYKDPSFLEALLKRDDINIYHLISWGNILSFTINNMEEAGILILLDKIIDDMINGKAKPLGTEYPEYATLLNVRITGHMSQNYYTAFPLYKAITKKKSAKLIARLILAGGIFYSVYLSTMILQVCTPSSPNYSNDLYKALVIILIPWLKRRLPSALITNARWIDKYELERYPEKNKPEYWVQTPMDIVCTYNCKSIKSALIDEGVDEGVDETTSSCSLQGGRRRKSRLRRSKKAKSRAKRSTKRR
jgi:hypothetical protein